MPKMTFEIVFTTKANTQMDEIERSKDKKAICKAVHKTLGLMEVNLRHPSLNTHEYNSLEGPNREKVFESYAQNNTAGAYRVFWHYGPNKGQITIISIVPHP